MPGQLKYSVDAIVSILDNTGSAPNTMASLAASGGGAINATSPAYDNSSNLNLWADFDFRLAWGSNPSSGGTVDLYLVPSIDGTTYVDATGSNTPSSVVAPASHYAGSVIVRAATAQRLALRGVPLPPFKFNVLIVNNTSIALATSGTTQSLKMVPYREQY